MRYATVDQQLVLVTGGSRGIGRAIVERLAADGIRVAFTWHRDEAAAESVVASTSGLARAYHLDLRDRARPASLVREIEEGMGPLTGLVNNAGVQRSELLAMTSDEEWDELIDVNLGGTFRCCRAALRSMVARRQGAVVSVASLSATHGVAGHGAYAASKAAIVAMSRCLAREMGRRGIRVNVVVPGYVATDMTAGVPDATVTKLRAGEVLAGGTDADAVADAVAFLLSDRARAITGQTVTVDAGTSA